MIDMTLLKHVPSLYFHLRPYRDEPSASRPIRADKHRRGQRVLTWVTSREHCAAAGFFWMKPDPFFGGARHLPEGN